MELLRLPITLYNIGVHTYNATQHVRFHLQEKKAFYQSLSEFLDHQVTIGNLIHVQQPQNNAAAAEWVMTDQGAQAIFQIYTDVYPTLQASADAASVWQDILSNKVVIRRSNKAGSSRALRKKIGTGWRQHLRDEVLRDKNLNPFFSLPRVKHLGRYRMAMGLLRKSTHSDGFGSLIVSRALGLAQLCGIGEVDFGDIHELLTHAHFYEILYRGYLARVVGNIDTTWIANIGYGYIFENRPLGSTPLAEGSAVAFTTPDQIVEIGSIIQSRVALSSFPIDGIATPPEFRIPSAAAVRNGEIVYMHAGWANCFKLRSRIKTQSFQYPVQHDVHQSPLYGSLAQFSFKLKRLDGRLVAVAPTLGSTKLFKVSGQGLFGRPCGCHSHLAARTVHAARKAIVNGVEIVDASEVSMRRLMYHNVYLLWGAQDIATQIWLANSYAHSTYIQVSGECLYCAINRAMGTGCSFLVAGGGLAF